MVLAGPCWFASSFSLSQASAHHAISPCHLALKCDLRDDSTVKERLNRYGSHTVQYEEGLAVARRIRASRYLGQSFCYIFRIVYQFIILALLTECSSKHNRGVTEVFYEAARVSLSSRAKGSSDGGCVLM